MADIGFGVIGAGYMGKAYAIALSQVSTVYEMPGCVIRRVIATSDAAGAQGRARDFGFERGTGDWRDLLAAAERGLAVFCEKPISLDWPTVAGVTDAVEASGIRCMLGFQRRYDPNFRAVRDRIASGKSGRLEQLVMHTRDPGPPPIDYVRRSGGMLRDQVIHDFDQARYMCGEEIASIYAFGNCQIGPAIGEAGDIDTLR